MGVIDKNKKLTLHTQAAQVFQKYISKNIYEIENRDELKKYLEGGIIKKEIDIDGQCVIKYKDYVLGTAVVSKTGIKSRFPRAKRTQHILTALAIFSRALSFLICRILENCVSSILFLKTSIAASIEVTFPISKTRSITSVLNPMFNSPFSAVLSPLAILPICCSHGSNHCFHK